MSACIRPGINSPWDLKEARDSLNSVKERPVISGVNGGEKVVALCDLVNVAHLCGNEIREIDKHGLRWDERGREGGDRGIVSLFSGHAVTRVLPGTYVRAKRAIRPVCTWHSLLFSPPCSFIMYGAPSKLLFRE